MRNNHGTLIGTAYERLAARPASARAGRAGGLERVRGSLQPKDLRLVPSLGAPGGRRPGRNANRSGEARRDDASICLRPVAEFPGLAEDSDPPRLVRLRSGAATPR